MTPACYNSSREKTRQVFGGLPLLPFGAPSAEALLTNGRSKEKLCCIHGTSTKLDATGTWTRDDDSRQN
jgi:hypothetical protein